MIRPVLLQPLSGAALAGCFLCTLLVSPGAAFEPITPIPAHIDYDRAKALLGRKLFNDPVLSSDRTVSCASCHDLNGGGCDEQPVSIGIKGRQGVMNSPTVFNAFFNFRQGWNGRDRQLREQANGPIHNPVEMQMTNGEVEARLNADPAYRLAFHQAYGSNRVAYPNVIDAIAEFEKALITPDSRFDRYLRGEGDLSGEEKKGYGTFKELGCITCHNGVNVGGNSFQKVGVLTPFPWDGRQGDRFKVTGDLYDKNVYKVPTLRNIESTAPYFHDGSKKTLREALTAMTTHNLGLELSPAEERSLIAFLRTLTGHRPEILAEDRVRGVGMVAIAARPDR